MQARIINLDGSIVDQAALIERLAPTVLDLTHWGPHLRMACRFGAFRRFERELHNRMPAARDETPAITFLGSGDFHHVTLALLRQLSKPFNLLVIDKHPDWMRGIPVLHCGTWLRHALRLGSLQKVFHVGGDLDFDNLWRLLAPWQDLRSGRITVVPAHRHFRGGWNSVPHRPLMRPGDSGSVSDALDEALHARRRDLKRWPLYISLDKDAMSAGDATVNWDSGSLGFAEVCEILDWFGTASDGRLAGMDVVGDWSPVRMAPGLRTLCHWTEHPTLTVDPAAAARHNGKMNEAIVEQMQEWMPVRRLPALKAAAAR